MIYIFIIFGFTIKWWMVVITCVVAVLAWLYYEIRQADKYYKKQEDARLNRDVEEFLSDKEAIEFREMLDDINDKI